MEGVIAVRAATSLIAVAVLVGAVAPLVCFCASEELAAEPPSCHAATAVAVSDSHLSIPCCCVGAGGERILSLATKANDERAPKFSAPSSPPSIAALVLAHSAFAPAAFGPPSTHSPPRILTPLRV